MKRFKVFTIGWEPYLINDLLAPIEIQVDFSFTHGLVGNGSRISYAQKKYPKIKFVSISKTSEESLPAPDYKLLANLESVGIPTIKSMVMGDCVLRYRPEGEAFGYATLLARRIRDRLIELQPDVILGSHDSVHAWIGLAVAKSMGIPWVAMSFTTIPENLTGFSKALTPNSLVPIVRPVDQQLRFHAKSLIRSVLSKKQKIMAHRAPATFSQWMQQYIQYGKNIFWRRRNTGILGCDRFICPSFSERLYNVVRRSFNHLMLPKNKLLDMPPEGKYVYYPLHMAPESVLDTWAPFYQNQFAFVEQLLIAIPADTAFVIKLHFSDPDNYSRRELQQLMKLPRLHIAQPDAQGSVFIEKASLVVGIQGTSCLEASLRGKPVLLFGDSPYQYFPLAERAKRPDEIYGQIQRMLSLAPVDDAEIEDAFATYMARYMPGRINDWEQPLDQREVDSLANCFLALRSYIEDQDNRAFWYRLPPFLNG